MISPFRVTQPSSKSSTIAAARARPLLSSPSPPVHPRPRSLTQETALEQNESPPDPLWIIAIGMAVFFAVAAFLMLAF